MVELVNVLNVNGEEILLNPNQVISVSKSRVPTEVVLLLSDSSKIIIPESELSKITEVKFSKKPESTGTQGN